MLLIRRGAGGSERLPVLQFMLVMPAVTAFLALNFTGATTFTSRSGVGREIFTYIPAMTWAFGSGILLSIVSIFTQLLGG